MYQKPSINYAYFVEDVSRKFTLKKNKCSNKTLGTVALEPARYMGGAVRNNKRFDTVSTTPVKKNYMFLRFNPRTSTASADELALRLAFTRAAKLREYWKTTLVEGQKAVQAWNESSNGSASGVHKKGYTYLGWLFAVAYALVSEDPSTTQSFPTYTPAS